MRFLLVSLLFYGPALFAREAHDVFSACKDHHETPERPEVAGKCCTSSHNPPLKTLTLTMDRTLENEEVAKAGEKLHEKILAKLDESIKARRTLIECTESDSEDCKKRIEFMRVRLSQNARLIRVLSAFADPKGESVSALGRVPGYGGGEMIRLSKREIETAQQMQRRVMDTALEQGSIDIDGHNYTAAQLQEFCKKRSSELSNSCERAATLRTAYQRQFRKEMYRLMGDVISSNPFATRFTELPITEEKLKKELNRSEKALEDWREEVAKKSPDDSELMAGFPDLLNDVLSEHPQFCGTVTKRYEEIESDENIKEWTRTAAKLTAMVGACIYSEGLWCLAVGVGAVSPGVYEAGKAMSDEKKRFSSLDSEGLTDRHKVREKIHDFFAEAAFSVGLNALVVEKEISERVAHASALKGFTRTALRQVGEQGKDNAIHHFGTAGGKATLDSVPDEADTDNFRTYVRDELVKNNAGS
jgi:hypothetical protein